MFLATKMGDTPRCVGHSTEVYVLLPPVCVEEKSAIQALDRLDPVLPLSPGALTYIEDHHVGTDQVSQQANRTCPNSRGTAGSGTPASDGGDANRPHSQSTAAVGAGHCASVRRSRYRSQP